MRYPLLLLLTPWVSLGWSPSVLAHGVQIQHQIVSGIEIQARYDSGEPMEEAQVTVYAPDRPTEPWMTGTTDTAGRFMFTPDKTQPGNWEVMVRQAGHGNVLSIPVEAEALAADPAGETLTPDQSPGQGEPSTQATLTSQPGELSPVQRWVTIGAVIWGFIGTALFFSRGKR
jgi:nickel transport protein